MCLEWTLANITNMLAALLGKQIDIIYHPHSAYRMIKQGDARITRLYEHFFAVEIDTGTYGTYQTTITYRDVYTKSCIISVHKENQSAD